MERQITEGSLLQSTEIVEGRYAFGWHQNIFISAWWETASEESLIRLQRSHKDFVTKVSGPLLSCSILYQTRPRPASKEERRLIGEVWAHEKDRFVGMYFYVRAGGLLTASLRLLLSGVQLLSKANTPLHINNNLPETIAAMATSAKLDAAQLTHSIQVLSHGRGL